MNRLKHILGVNVPGHVPSNAASSSRHLRKNRQFRPQLSGPDSLFVTKGSHGVDIRYSGHCPRNGTRLASRSKTICKLRSKTKTSVASLKKSSTSKQSLSQSAVRAARHYSTYENAKFNSSDERRTFVNVAMINAMRNINRNSSFVTSVERHPRSYAEIIADYSEALYKGSSAVTTRLRFNDTTRKSPFSTSSISPLRGRVFTAMRKSDLPFSPFTLYDAFKSRDRCIRHERTNERGAFERDDTLIIESTNKKDNNRITTSDSKNETDQSYAKLVVDCSRSMRNISHQASVPNGGDLASRRNVLTRNFLESFAAPTRRVSSTNAREILHRSTSAIAATPIEKSIERQMADKIDGIEKSEGDVSTRRNNYSQLCDTTCADLPRYFSEAARGTRPSTFARKSSTRMLSGGIAGASKRSQVELRMMPSEKESVVSVNVDSVLPGSANLLDSATKELSVVVRSDRKRDARSAEAQRSVPTFRQSADFGPMRISISEDSAPVKQIEFSVNGKPVSELRSITARTERLDVMSSVDKVEIRIPFAKDDAITTGKIRESDLSRSIDPGTEQVLNVQIFANFQNREPAKDSTERPYKAKATDTVPTSSSRTPKTHYVFKDPGKIHFTNFDARQQYESDGTNVRSDIEENINNDKAVSNADFKIQSEVGSKLPDNRMTNVSSIESTSKLDIGSLNANYMMDTLRSTETNKYNKNESFDTRVPSKIVPWWSSSDCFNKIRKKEDDRKPVATSNINKKKDTSSSQRNLTAEFSKTKKSSRSSKILPRNARPMNNTIITTNTGNPISYSNSLEQREESTPSAHYPCLFRLKPDRKNLGTISEMMKNVSKIENSQISSTMKMSGEKISETKRTGPVVLSTSGTANIQSERDVSIEPDRHVEKASVLSEKFKVPTGEQDLPFKTNRERKHDDPLSQTKSIDDMPNSKSRIKNILNAVKPIEKKKDGTLIDYGLKVPSRKPTVGINSEAIEDLFSATGIKSRENTSKKSTAKIVARSERIDKTIRTKRSKTDSQDERRFEMEMSTKKEEENSIVKNIATPVKVQNEDNVKNKALEQTCQSDAKISTDLRKSLELMQPLKKQEKTADDTIILQNDVKQNLKSLEPNRDRSDLSGVDTSKTIENLEKLSRKAKQSKQKTLSGLETASGQIESHGSEKSKDSKSSKLENIQRPSGESADNRKMEDRKKSSLETVNEMQIKSGKTDKSFSQTKPDLISKIKDDATHRRSIEKHARMMSIAQRSTDRLHERTDVGNITAKIVIRRSAGKDSLLENREKSRPRESNKGVGNFAGSTDFPRKPSGSADSKSFNSKRSGMKSNENCTYARKLLFTESSCVSFDRKDATLSNLRPAVFKDLNNVVGGAAEDRAPGVTGSAAPWTDIDRPEKDILYSAWLHRFRNDVNNKKRLF